MWNAIVTGGGWVLVGAVVLWWAWWTRKEREHLGNGKWRIWE